ncbi:MAG: hypothetical protein MJ175_10870 [Clostridia bacterium]|nr:hypothetical protein [Clostridia bacterium]
MNIPVIKGRRLNKLLCLTFLSMALVFLIIAGIYRLSGEPVLAEVLCVLAGIVGIFCLFYGFLWFIYYRTEQKRQTKLMRAAEILAQDSEEERADDHEFIIPREALTEAAWHHFRSIALALVIAALTAFMIVYGILLITNGFGGIAHLLITALFCFLVTLPGTLVQYIIYRNYARSVPGRILLFPGKLLVDERQFTVRDIEKVTISSYRSANSSSAALYRKLTVQTAGRTFTYTIDYRAAGGNPRWAGYGLLLVSLQTWAQQNRVTLVVDYMN